MRDLGLNARLRALVRARAPEAILAALAFALANLFGMTAEAPDPPASVPECSENAHASEARNTPETPPRLVRLMIIGHVKRPGPYHVSVPVTFDRLLDMAGGPTAQAVTNVVHVHRMVRELDASERQRLAPLLSRASENTQFSMLLRRDQFEELSARLVDFNAVRILSAEELENRWQHLQNPSP